MDSYMHFLMSVCATMMTGVVIIAGIDLMVFGVFALWNLVRDELDL
jgi:Flp pilus assembly protein TadB